MNERLYLLKIQLRDIEPAIWRRFVVPISMYLDQLHHVIQAIMGWNDAHVHQFTFGRFKYKGTPDTYLDGVCGRYRLGDLAKRKGQIFSYVYDFGDCWDHELVLEDNRYINPELKTELVCLEGERACPPEDVGGFIGYENYCEALENPKDDTYQSYRETFGSNYDSEKFDIELINKYLMNNNGWLLEKN